MSQVVRSVIWHIVDAGFGFGQLGMEDSQGLEAWFADNEGERRRRRRTRDPVEADANRGPQRYELQQRERGRDREQVSQSPGEGGAVELRSLVDRGATLHYLSSMLGIYCNEGESKGQEQGILRSSRRSA